MLQGIIARGTTPTLAFPLPDNLYSSDLKEYSICYRQKNKTLLRYTQENTVQLPGIDKEKNIILIMSQEDTLKLNAKIPTVEVQIRAVSTGNDVFIIGEYSFRVMDCFDSEAFDLTK